MAKYYFVGTLLPFLSFENPPEISFTELEELLRDNLAAYDYEKTLLLRRFYDLLNLRALWLEEELDPRGELDVAALEEAIMNGVGLPDYLYDFIERYPKKEERLHHFPFLLAKFFQTAELSKDLFLRQYFRFERELRFVLTAFRAKKLKKSLSIELQYENPEEELIAQILAQQDAKTYDPPEKYKELKMLFDQYGVPPLNLQKALDEYRVETIKNLVNEADIFSIDYFLGYLAQFMIIEKWFELDREQGIKIVNTIV